MNIRTASFALLSSLVVGVAGCNGSGDGGDSPAGGACSVLKIAGGEKCSNPPASVVAVRVGFGYCSGTFITPRHVLTAAHCFEFNPSSVRIESSYFSYSATRWQVHPQFNPNSVSNEYDVAVVTIGSDAPVTPVPIMTSRAVTTSDTVVTYGYGLDEDDNTLDARIREGGVALKATTLAIISVSDFAIQSISDGSGDTCQGDSGGALLLDGADGSPGAVAVVRAGPSECRVTGGPSDNTNLQVPSITSFIQQAAPGVQLN